MDPIDNQDLIRGKPVSGKVWKTLQTKRSSSMTAHKRGWDRQQKERRQREIILTLKKEKEEEKRLEKEVYF